jgi:hypothetical protein
LAAAVTAAVERWRERPLCEQIEVARLDIWDAQMDAECRWNDAVRRRGRWLLERAWRRYDAAHAALWRRPSQPVTGGDATVRQILTVPDRVTGGLPSRARS